jgi:hypothetical protein
MALSRPRRGRNLRGRRVTRASLESNLPSIDPNLPSTGKNLPSIDSSLPSIHSSRHRHRSAGRELEGTSGCKLGPFVSFAETARLLGLPANLLGEDVGFREADEGNSERNVGLFGCAGRRRQTIAGLCEAMVGVRPSEVVRKASKPGCSGSMAGRRAKIAGSSGSMPGRRATIAGRSGSMAGHRATIAGCSGSMAGRRAKIAGRTKSIVGRSKSIVGCKKSMVGRTKSKDGCRRSMGVGSKSIAGCRRSMTGCREFKVGLIESNADLS